MVADNPMAAQEFGNMGVSRGSSTVATSVVVWMTCPLGLEVVMAIRRLAAVWDADTTSRLGSIWLIMCYA